MTVYRGDFTQRDADSILEELRAYITRNYPGVELDFSDDSVSLEAILMDAIVHGLDANHLYIDAAHSEHYVDTAVESQSLHSLAKLVGAPLGRRNAATAELTYTYTKTDPAAPNSILLPLGFSLPNDSGFSWTVVDSLQTVALAGGTFEAAQGSFVTETFGASGEPNQVVLLSNRRVAANVTPEVTVAGVTWTAADSIARCGAGQYYELKWIGYGRLAVVFGDGANGDVPGGDVEVTFFSTDGEDGNCPAGTVVGKANPHADVDLEYTNDDAVYDGDDGMDVRDARRFISGYGSRAGTEVTISDYKTIIESQSGVQYANFEFDEATRRIVCYVLSSAWGTLTDGQLARLARTIRGDEQFFTSFVFKNVHVASAIVAMKVVFDRASRLDTTTKRQSVVDAVEDFFQPPAGAEVTNAVGKTIRLSDFFRAVDSVPGVDHVNLDVFTRVPTLEPLSWSTTADAIALNGWYLRPSSMTYGSAGVGSAMPSGTGSMLSADVAKVSRRAAQSSPATQLSVVGARASSDDWNTRASSAYPDKVKVRLSMVSRRYVWPGWYDDAGDVPEPLTTDLLARTGAQTAHFVTSHFVDGQEYADASVGYVGKAYETDGGFMLFTLSGPSSAGSSSGRCSTDGTWATLELDHSLLVAGSLSGYVTIGASTYSLDDNGDGAILDASGSKVGYVDYDTGWLVFDVSALSVGGNVATVSYQYYTFDNLPGEEAEMWISSVVGDIRTRPNEFCALSDLSVEIAVD